MPVSPMSALDYVFIPLATTIVLALFVLVLRWTYADRGGRGTVKPGGVGDHGLLVPMTTVRDPQRAASMVAALNASGIRASLSGDAGRQLLLVWPTQVDEAWQRLAELSRDER
ncbi:MAG: hypothetical protein H0V13_12220 [Nocardioidaceae bacterium]|nr:hypothetical protein [Nocardioidaceae bacterium]